MKLNSIAQALLIGAALASCHSLASAQQASIELEVPRLLKSADGQLIDTSHRSIPTVADIDGDGKKDLVVGQFMNHKAPWLRKADQGTTGSSGTARWHRNLAEEGVSPKYAPGIDLKSDMAYLYKPRAGLTAKDRERLKGLSALAKRQAGAAYVSAEAGERRKLSRALSQERNKLAESMSRKNKRGLLWLLRRQTQQNGK